MAERVISIDEAPGSIPGFSTFIWAARPRSAPRFFFFFFNEARARARLAPHDGALAAPAGVRKVSMSSWGKTGRPGQVARAGPILRRAHIRPARRTIFLETSVQYPGSDYLQHM